MNDDKFRKLIHRIIDSYEMPAGKEKKILYKVLKTLFGDKAKYSEKNPI